jgi:serine/threonine protein phosphatase PrpC
MSVRQSFGFPLGIEVGTDVGRIRDNNEDSVGHAWLDDGSLFVIVADGMGGHEAGEVASSLAVRVSEDIVRQEPDADPRDRLHAALIESNQAILDEGASSGTRGMGTTAIAAIIKGNQVYVGQVGDSRCYHFRKGHKLWRSTDHTRVQMLVDQGQLSEEEARHHPEAGMLTRALGHARMADGKPLVPVVIDDPILLERGDTVMLCSDGLHDLVDDHEIGQIIAGKSAQEAIRRLIEIACDRGGHDNITIAIVTAGDKIQPFDPKFVPPNQEYRSSEEMDQSEDHLTFDFTDQVPGTPEVFTRPSTPVPPPHLHAPTVAPGEDFEPIGRQDFVGRGAAEERGQAATSTSRLPLLIGIGLAALLLALGIVACLGAGLVYWMLTG